MSNLIIRHGKIVNNGKSASVVYTFRGYEEALNFKNAVDNVVLNMQKYIQSSNEMNEEKSTQQ